MATHDRLLRPAVLAAGSLLVLSTLLIALWVPSDRAEGYRQRIFYLHVPIALTSYLFLAGRARSTPRATSCAAIRWTTCARTSRSTRA